MSSTVCCEPRDIDPRNTAGICDTPSFAHLGSADIEKALNPAGFVTLDSGQRESFQTGAVRDVRSGKGRYDLISPLALKRLADVYERGAAKYSPDNWAKGIPMRRCFDSAVRHLYQYLEGDRSEDHLAQAMWNCAALVHFDEAIKRGILPKELDDMPNYIPRTTDANSS